VTVRFRGSIGGYDFLAAQAVFTDIKTSMSVSHLYVNVKVEV
jgi:hypothetical protein